MNSHLANIGDDEESLSERIRTLTVDDEVSRFGMTEGENNAPNFMNPEQPVLNVTPLNWVPYTGPSEAGDTFTSSTKEKTETSETTGPAMIFLPSEPTKEELDKIMSNTKDGLAVTGAAATGSLGGPIGLVDIGELDDSYYFSVTVPGVSTNKKDFNCDIEPDGKVLIRGVSTTGENIVCRDFQIFHMMTQNLCPPGPFTVSFQLPGPVNPQEVNSRLADGILEAIVKKKK